MATELTRRQMMIVSAFAAAAFTPIGRALGAAAVKGPVDAGNLSKYATEGIYPDFQPQGFFIIRQGDHVFAQSSICTHKGCKLTPATDGFHCKCHGSTFALDGKVTKAPARRDLPRYTVSKNDQDHLLVDLSSPLDSSKTDAAGAYVVVATAK